LRPLTPDGRESAETLVDLARRLIEKLFAKRGARALLPEPALDYSAASA
jgi:hypothetical protein